jgi:TolB-like protein/DNA-binding winged helix-turn-helix (wHTH) protein
MYDTTVQADRARLRLLGAFTLMTANGARVDITSRRARGLLAFIHLSPDHTAQRERLCGMFWGDRGEAQARASLRQCLFELRDGLSAAGLDILEVGRETVALRAQSVTSDLAELERALKADDIDAVTALLAAIGRERLLATFELGGLFQDWLDQARAQVEQTLADGVQALLARLAAAGRWATVRSIADAFLQRDPLDEAVVAAAIRADMASGAATAAHRRFQALKEALAKEFGVAPGAAVCEAIGQAAAAPAPRQPPSASRNAQGSDRPAIAVLPFGFPPGDQDQAYFAEGLAEDIIAGLARSRLLTVLPRQSSLTFDASGLNTERICAGLGVDYIVQGQVRRTAATVRVSAQLINGVDDKTVWSAHYDRPIDDLFAVQDDITTAVVSTIEPALLTHEEARALRAPNRNLAHWDLFMRGRWHFWRSTIPDSRKARDLLTQALTLKPDDAQAQSLLAHCHLVDVWAGVARDPGQSIAEAYRYALRAVHLDGSDAFAHFTLGVVLSTMGRPDQDMAEQRCALELNPNLPAASGEMGRLFAFAGRVDEALTCCDRAVRASPNDPHVWLWLFSKAIACFLAERYEEAATHAADACARRPDYFFLHFLQAACAVVGDRASEARIAMAQGLRLMPRYSLAALKRGHPFVNPDHLNRYVEALKGAGWVDS